MLLSSSVAYHCDFAKVAVMLMDVSSFLNAEEKLERLEKEIYNDCTRKSCTGCNSVVNYVCDSK